LDWTRPWTFLESLQRWVHVLQHRIDEICKDGTVGESWSKGKTIVDELREKGKKKKKKNKLEERDGSNLKKKKWNTIFKPTQNQLQPTQLI
jgi:hypothetical protein